MLSNNSIVHDITENYNSLGTTFSQSSHNSGSETVTNGLTLEILQTALNCIDFAKFKDLLKFKATGSKIKSFTAKAVKRLYKLIKGNSVQKPLQEIRSAKPKKTETELKAKYETFLENYPEAKLIYKHWKDLELSSIDDGIKALNYVSVEGNTTYNYILSDVEKRLNTGALTASTLRMYGHLYAGAMVCKTVDLINNRDESEWCQVKPNQPRPDKKGKPIRYEAPKGKKGKLTELYALRLPRHIKEKFCDDPLVLDGQDWEFWQYVRDNGLTIVITEGSKKAAALLSHGILAIAVSGVWLWGVSEKDGNGKVINRELIPALQYFVDVPREWVVCFDSDSKHKTIVSVSKALNSLGFEIKKQKSTVSVMRWNGAIGKGIDDLIFNVGKDYLDIIYQSKIPFLEWGTSNLNKLLIDADLLINKEKIGVLDIPADRNLIFIKSDKNTGKTWSMAEWLKQFSEGEQKRILAIVHRVQLGRALCEKFKLPYVDEKTEQSQIDKLAYGYGLCINSLHPYSQARFNPESWKGAILVLDEVCQLIWHLLTDPHMKQQRVRVFNNLKLLLNTVIKSGGKIICADADLNDIAVNFISGLIDGNKKRYIIVNEYKYKNPWKICHFTGNTPGSLVKVAFDQLKQGKKLLFCLSGQQIKAKYGSQYLFEEIKKRFPDLKILIVDGHTVADPQNPAYKCTERLNEVLLDYDVVLCTSVIETGVSIDIDRFDAVFGIFSGLQTANTVRQFLARYRKPVPRFIWINKKGLTKVGNGMIWANGILRDEKNRQAELKDYLKENGLQEDLETGDFSFDPFTTAWAKFGAFINYTNRNYRDSILNGLREEGHIICDNVLPTLDYNPVQLPSESEEKALRKEIAEGCKEAYRVDRVETSEADDIEPLQLETLKKQREMTVKERRELRKASIKQSYGVEIVTEELIKADDKDLYNRLQLFYLWSKGRELMPKLDIRKAELAKKYGDGRAYLIDLKSYRDKVELLDSISFDKLLELDNFDRNNETLQECFEAILNNFWKFQKLFFPLTEKWKIEQEILENPMEMAQRIVGWVGLAFVIGKRVGSDGNRVQMWHKPACKVIDANQVCEYWYTRDLERLEKHETEKAKERELMEEMGINSTTEFFQSVPNYEPNRETVTGNESYGIPPTLDVESFNVMLQTRTKEEAKALTEIILPQVVDGFTLKSEHIDVIPVVKQLVAGTFKECREDVKMLADEFLKALRGSIDLVKVIAHVDGVLADDLSCQMLADCY
ncbi:plasmid replication protein, CyRepA1 family [Dolichospermum sp. UHCC 0259]|uniref:plasmid replication protein, CyRepA1 family n=1 Tax=Dolichospermum sp. UHCC 0259 TaxID=2590010 RepID=UPI0014480717|nr:plasmid replication protein, CyRepA1 family [Dolichospermum sp. UHCC 0259]MTJ49114.1 DUF3854 domain-containing protein [Dolichospermum sp. UHCC 0259]